MHMMTSAEIKSLWKFVLFATLYLFGKLSIHPSIHPSTPKTHKDLFMYLLECLGLRILCNTEKFREKESETENKN